MDQNQVNDIPAIAASSYLNTAPLIWSFLHGSQRRSVQIFTDKAPARCAEMLSNGDVAAALVPIIEYHRIPEGVLVPDVCVGSRAAVRSVVIASKQNNLKKIRRVALDESSRTSSVLVKIIFREFLGFEPEWESAPPNLRSMLGHNDAALMIGDPAMTISSEEFRVFDLATLWHEFTGFGFVFAMWMAGRKDAGRIRTIDFKAARDEGLANLDTIAAQHRGTGLSLSEIRDYLTKNIAFQMDEEMLKGLRFYFELALKHGLIEQDKPLEFL